jgi:ubiquinone/menaquinone biosynthesis C-methylase UbiE
MTSIAFDRAADDYDATRALPADAMRRVVGLLSGEIADRAPTLEVGVGTGRLALPLAAAGARMVGVDLSAPMLGKLVEKSGGRRVAVALVRGDATGLPFPDASFGSAIAAHVLHLISEWPTAAHELVRTVKPGGVILVDIGGWGRSWWREVQDVFAHAAAIEMRFIGVRSWEELDAAMTEFGARPRELVEIPAEAETTIEEHVELLAKSVYSFTWGVEEAMRRRAAEEARAWAATHVGSTAQPRILQGSVRWRAYDR